MGRLEHLLEEGVCYHITSTTHDRQPLFRDPDCAEILWKVINTQRERGRFHLLAFAIMPDHVHLLLAPRNGTSLGLIMQEIKKGSARLVNHHMGRRGKVWIDEYYDHGLRSEKEVWEKIAYIHGNPVKEGLSEEESAYPFSSANPAFDGYLWKDW